MLFQNFFQSPIQIDTVEAFSPFVFWVLALKDLRSLNNQLMLEGLLHYATFLVTSQYGHKDCTEKKFYMVRRKIGFCRSC